MRTDVTTELTRRDLLAGSTAALAGGLLRTVGSFPLGWSGSRRGRALHGPWSRIRTAAGSVLAGLEHEYDPRTKAVDR